MIGGNGTGIPVYRKLQRAGIPFAAGILHGNDVDCEVARALAAEVIEEQPFSLIREEVYQKAVKTMEQCAQVICCVNEFGPVNEKNRQLCCLAEKAGNLHRRKDSAIIGTLDTYFLFETERDRCFHGKTSTAEKAVRPQQEKKRKTETGRLL